MYCACSNGAPSEKFKLKKWHLVTNAKKPKNKGVMDGAPLTQEGICQAYQLIEFLKKEQSWFNFELFLGFCTKLCCL